MEKLTIEEVLKITIKGMKEIEIPVTMVEKIGIPVSRAIHNLEECVIAIERDSKEKAEENEDGGNADSE